MNSSSIGVPSEVDPSSHAVPSPRAMRAHHPAWPVQWRDVGMFGVAYLFLCAVWIAAGKIVTGPLNDSLGAADQRAIENFAANRTPRLDTLSHYGTLLAETQTKIILTGVVVLLFVLVWRWWDGALLVAVPLLLEAAVFISVTFVVSRPRPDVERLDGSPVDSSFPSGHVAAAVVYGAFAVLAFRYRKQLLGVVLGILTLVVAAIVAWSRMYRGMHFPSDVIAGALLGGASIALSTWIVTAAIRRRDGAEHEEVAAGVPIQAAAR